MLRMESAPVALPQIMVNLWPDGGTNQGRCRRLGRRFDDGNPTPILWNDGRILRKCAAIEKERGDGGQQNLDYPGVESFFHGLRVPD